MFIHFSIIPLVIIFLSAAIAVWVAGIYLLSAVDILDARFGVSQAFGGLVILAIVTNLPEIAIVLGAALKHNFGIIIGNILGGIAIQTVVLVVLDGFGLRRQAALTYRAASLQLVLEGLAVITVLLVTIMGAQLPKSLIFMRFAPGDVLVVAAWLAGLYLVGRSRSLAWYKKNPEMASHKGKNEEFNQKKTRGIKSVLLFFVGLSIVTLLGGLILEESGSAIADYLGWSGVLFGSTILAAATALPEISTGLKAIKLRAYTLAVSDIFGGNAFLPVLFFITTLISGQSVLPEAKNADIYLASLGAVLTAIYIYGLMFRSKKQFICLGIDSVVAVVLYIVAIVGLFFIVK